MKKITVVFVLTALLTGCGTYYDREPVGIGKDYSDLKKSPCACLQIQMEPGLPDWMRV